MPSKQSERRNIAKLRSALMTGKPMAIYPPALGGILAALESGLDDAVSMLEVKPRDEMQAIGGVAVIPVLGVLQDAPDIWTERGFGTAYQDIERQFAAAMADESIKSVALYIDSPGGSAIGAKRLADAIHAARGSKPIVAYTPGMMASAGYYIGAAADRIEAAADAMVGSIGTISEHQDISKALDEFGIKVTVLTNDRSPNKGLGNPYEPLTAEAKAKLLSFVDSYGESFIADVARYRNTTPANVAATFGGGDVFRGDAAVGRGMVDRVVTGFRETLRGVQPAATSGVFASSFFGKGVSMEISKIVRAQLFASKLIESPDTDDATCKAVLHAWFRGSVPVDEAGIVKGLQASAAPAPDADPTELPEDDTADTGGEDGDDGAAKADKPAPAAKKNREQLEARAADLKASADLFRGVHGPDAVSEQQLVQAISTNMSPAAAVKAWTEALGANDSVPVRSPRVTVKGDGRSRFAEDAASALALRAGAKIKNPSEAVTALASYPLFAIAGRCLEMSGERVDPYGDREETALRAMEAGANRGRTVSYGANESARYIKAGGAPAARPGDFPHILSNLANKFIDNVELDEEYSYPAISAVLPTGLDNFKATPLINKGTVDELDEVGDGAPANELGISEELLSYLFMQRYRNKFGWTPVLVANDDMNAFAESMLGFATAWQRTQNRRVLSVLTSNATLLDGTALFADRANASAGGATNNNDRTSGGTPSDAEWEAMSILYADIAGVGSTARVRGTLNTALVPTGTVQFNALRMFAAFGQLGETKVPITTATTGIFRGSVNVVADSELRANSAVIWYGMRSPTVLNTATIVRAYFNGYGEQGRRETWYDPERQTTWIALEGRVAVAAKNWRYAIRNAGA